MKIYDCFTFYNEIELLELRLKALWDVVDCFVIVEADRKHTNEPKPYYFWERQEEFREFFPKIRHLPIEMTIDFKGVGDWSIENAQRDAIAYGLEDAAPDDLILISDLDEIPAPDIFQRLRDNSLTLTGFYLSPPLVREEQFKIPAKLLVPAMNYLEVGAITLEQAFHYYYFDWISSETWKGTVMVKRKNLTTPQQMRNMKDTFPRASEGGHHFSYMGGVDRVIDKMTSIVEGPVLIKHLGEKILDKNHLEEALANGTDIYNRQGISSSQFCPYDANNIKLPGLRDFLKKYPQFLREPEKYFKE